MYTVCIAEDEYYVQKSIEARIRELHMEWEVMGCAFTGNEAEELYERYRPDLFFVDIYMPQCSGLDFIERIREKDQKSRTLFVIVSGYSDYHNMRRALTANVFDYLKKPIVPSEFKKLMENAAEELEKRTRTYIGGDIFSDEYLNQTGEKELIVQICEYIHAHFNDALNTKMLADLFYLSPSHLSHYFKKKKKLSLGKYLEEIRLQKAAEILLRTDFPIADIAEKVGYGDGNYFTKVFKKKYNKTPSDYRRDMAK